MKILRTLFVLLLCAMLPLTGLAVSGAAGPCPMESMESAMTDSAAVMATDMPGCDSMAQPSGASIKLKTPLCKVTAQCQMGSLYHPVSTPSVTRPAGSFVAVSFHFADSLSLRAPDGPWRPPRHL